MSYEASMLQQLAMPTRMQVEEALLRALFRHGGVIKEFAAGEQIVDELANELALNQQQRSAYLETIYRKENRIKKARLWHRLLFRAADALAKERLVTRPTETILFTKRKEWMLTERGFNETLRLQGIPISEKDLLAIKSFEVQKIVKKLVDSPRPRLYDPIDPNKGVKKITTESVLRLRGFRQAVIQAYNYSCAVCGLKMKAPDRLLWEVQAAHIVPNQRLGRDDIYNGIAMCHLHHWAFDAGWFTLSDDYRIHVSGRTSHIPADFGRMGSYDFFGSLADGGQKVRLPTKTNIRPHRNAMEWHRQNIFRE